MGWRVDSASSLVSGLLEACVVGMGKRTIIPICRGHSSTVEIEKNEHLTELMNAVGVIRELASSLYCKSSTTYLISIAIDSIENSSCNK